MQCILQPTTPSPFCDSKITFSTPSILSPESNVLFKRFDLVACQMQCILQHPTSLWPKHKVHNSLDHISFKSNALFKRLYACQNAMYLATPFMWPQNKASPLDLIKTPLDINTKIIHFQKVSSILAMYIANPPLLWPKNQV